MTDATESRQLAFSVQDGDRRAVARIRLVPAEDSAGILPELAKAAATAGIAFRELPAGTEYVYPAVARIGDGPIVCWQWRTDLVPRLQRVEPGMILFDASSEEGGMLIGWGFEPRVLGYIPNVRGAVTGVPEKAPPRNLKVRIRSPQAAVTLRPIRR